jgi:hypothetical protein
MFWYYVTKQAHSIKYSWSGSSGNAGVVGSKNVKISTVVIQLSGFGCYNDDPMGSSIFTLQIPVQKASVCSKKDEDSKT